MKYSKRKYRDKSIEVIEEVVATKKKRIKKQKGFFAKIKEFVKKVFKK